MKHCLVWILFASRDIWQKEKMLHWYTYDLFRNMYEAKSKHCDCNWNRLTGVHILQLDYRFFNIILLRITCIWNPVYVIYTSNGRWRNRCTRSEKTTYILYHWYFLQRRALWNGSASNYLYTAASVYLLTSVLLYEYVKLFIYICVN